MMTLMNLYGGYDDDDDDMFDDVDDDMFYEDDDDMFYDDDEDGHLTLGDLTRIVGENTGNVCAEEKHCVPSHLRT